MDNLRGALLMMFSMAGFAVAAFVLAIALVPLAMATALFQATPLFVMLGAILFFAERPDGLTPVGAAIVVGSGLYAPARTPRCSESALIRRATSV